MRQETDRLALSWLLCLLLSAGIAALAQQKPKPDEKAKKPGAQPAFPPEWLGPGPPAGPPRLVPMEPNKPEAWEKHLESPRVMSHRLLAVQRYQETLRGKLERLEHENKRQVGALRSKVDELERLLDEKRLLVAAKKPEERVKR